MGPGWSAARRQEVALGTSRLPEVLPDQARPVQALHHAPPSTLSSAWAQLTEKQQQESVPAGALDTATTAGGASMAAIAAARGPNSISVKSGSPVKAKVPALTVLENRVKALTLFHILQVLTLFGRLTISIVRRQQYASLRKRRETP